MNKQEIDDLMRDLPSQQQYYEEPLGGKILIGILFVGFMVLLAMLPDLARV
jgi:hypothetical protein